MQIDFYEDRLRSLLKNLEKVLCEEETEIEGFLYKPCGIAPQSHVRPYLHAELAGLVNQLQKQGIVGHAGDAGKDGPGALL